MKKEYKLWLNDFKKIHNLKSTNEAIYKLIDVYKAFHNRVLNSRK